MGRQELTDYNFENFTVCSINHTATGVMTEVNW